MYGLTDDLGEELSENRKLKSKIRELRKKNKELEAKVAELQFMIDKKRKS